MLYLPLYNGVEKLELGVPEGASLVPVAPREPKPVVVYGTSIAHGACASRPGMAWPAILSRALDREVVNLGFSGNGRMELEVGAHVAAIDAAAFVVDCLPNMTPAQVRERTVPLVRQLRRARPELPRPFRAPWHPFAPTVYFVAALLVLGGTLWQAPPEVTLRGLGITLLGALVYRPWRRVVAG